MGMELSEQIMPLCGPSSSWMLLLPRVHGLANRAWTESLLPVHPLKQVNMIDWKEQDEHEGNL